jgi:hypothetical protein
VASADLLVGGVLREFAKDLWQTPQKKMGVDNPELVENV